MRDLPGSILHNLGFLLAFIVVGLLAWEAQRTQQRLLDTNADIARSLQIISTVQSIRSSLQDVEIGARGFMLTGRADYLEPYELGREQVREGRNALAALLYHREPPRSLWLSELDTVVAQRLRIASDNIDRRRQLGLGGSARQLPASGAAQVMARARVLLAELENEEREQLAQRTAVANSEVDNARRKMLIGGLIVALLLLFAMWALARNQRLRRQLITEAWVSAQRQRALLQALPDTLYQISQTGVIEPISTPDRELREPPESLAGALLRGREKARLALHTMEWQDERGNDYEIRLMPTGQEDHVAIVRNVTDAQRTRRRLRDQQAFLRNVVDTDENLIFVRDQEGRFLLCNRAFSQLLGLRPAQVEGQPPTQIDRAELLEPLLAGDDALLRGSLPELRSGDLEIRDVRGRSRWLQLLKRPLLLSDGRRQVLAVAVDVSQRREVERMKAEFVSTVSHELRTPLTAIRGALSMLTGNMDDEISDDARPLINIAYKNSERLVTLINDILDIEKLQSGHLLMRLQPLPVRPLVAQAVEQIGPYARDFGVQVDLADGFDATVDVDPDRFAQVMANLLSNAIKHSPAGGKVSVWLDRRQHQVEISVADQGAGIPEEFRPRVFERFAQADSSDVRARGGTGLGLAITRSLVQQFGGTIGFDTEVDHGTRFWIRLPLDLPPPDLGPQMPPPRILLLDSDGDLAMQVARGLEARGHAATVATSASQAREMLDASPVHTLLLGLSLADEDGLRFLRRLRAQGRFENLPVLVIGRAEQNGWTASEQTIGNSLRVCDWLPRQIGPERVVEAIERCLRKPGAQPHVLLVDADTSLCDQLAVNLDEQPITFHAAQGLADARSRLADCHYDLVVLEPALPDGDGTTLLTELSQARPPTSVIVYTGNDATMPDNTPVLRRLRKSDVRADDLATLIIEHLKHWRKTPDDSSGSPP